MQRLFFFLSNANAKPYFVRLPADGHKEKYFLQSLILLTTETMTRFDGTCTSDGASNAHQGWRTQGPVYLCPRRSAKVFWTPKGLPSWGETDSHMFELGHEGFFCVWCIDLEAVCARHEFIDVARILVQQCGTQNAAASRVFVCTSSKNIQEFLRQDRKLCFPNQIEEPGATKCLVQPSWQLDTDVGGSPMESPDFRYLQFHCDRRSSGRATA